MNITEGLHITDPLLFAFLHIIDAAPFNVYPFAPRNGSTLSRLPSLIPATDAKMPAFSYIVTESRKQGNVLSDNAPAKFRGKVRHTIEAALWAPMPKPEQAEDCDWYYTALEKFTNPNDTTQKTGLNVKHLAMISGVVIELEAQLRSIIHALTQPLPKPLTGVNAFEELFGFAAAESEIITRTFTDTSAAQLIGVVARFDLWMKDMHTNYCKECGWVIDMSMLTTSAISAKMSPQELVTCN